jgi:hypothetical protein
MNDIGCYKHKMLLPVKRLEANAESLNCETTKA